MRGITGRRNYVVSVLAPVIGHEELGSLVAQDKPIFWTQVCATLKNKYGQLGRSLQDEVEARFRLEIAKDFIKLAKKSEKPDPDWVGIAHVIKQKYPDYD